MEILTLIGTVGTLASAVVGVWREIEQGRRRELDRAHAAVLQRAQHDHERLLAYVRQSGHPTVLVNAHQDGRTLARLEREAEYLSALNFEIVFEAVDSGYAIALPLAESVLLVFWLSPDYPITAPRVLVWISSRIDQVEFSPGSWNDERTLAEIVSALAPQFGSGPDSGSSLKGESK